MKSVAKGHGMVVISRYSYVPSNVLLRGETRLTILITLKGTGQWLVPISDRVLPVLRRSLFCFAGVEIHGDSHGDRRREPYRMQRPEPQDKSAVNNFGRKFPQTISTTTEVQAAEPSSDAITSVITCILLVNRNICNWYFLDL